MHEGHNGYVYVYDPLDPYKNGYYSIDSIWNQQSSDYGDLQNGGPFFSSLSRGVT